MKYMLDTAESKGDIMYYGNNAPKNNLVALTGDNPGSYIELVSGIGWHSNWLLPH